MPQDHIDKEGDIGFDNGLVPSSNMSLPKPMLTKTHNATMSKYEVVDFCDL